MSSPAADPLVLTETIGSRQIVAVACGTAQRHGVRAGMNLAEARALSPGLRDAPHEPANDRRGLEALGRWMMRFTPAVALEPPGAIFLEVGGSDRLFGSLERLRGLVVESVRRLRLHAVIALAPTPGAAFALTFAAENPPAPSPVERTVPWHLAFPCEPRPSGSVSAGRQTLPDGRGSPEALAPEALALVEREPAIGERELLPSLLPLPPASLRISPAVASMLFRLGVETIGQLMELPRSALPARFGDELLRRLDQALGRTPEPLTLLPHPSPVRAGMMFDGAIDDLETIWIVLRRLIGDITAELSRRGCGVRRLHVRFDRDRLPPIEHTVLLSRPSRNETNLFDLLKCALETLRTNAGFLGIAMEAVTPERIEEDQSLLIGDESHDEAKAFSRLIERLSARLGERAVETAELIESHLPELACRYSQAVSSTPVRACTGMKIGGPVPRSTPRQSSDSIDNVDRHPPRAARPLRLLTPPTEIAVIVTPSQDREGRPVSFTHRGDVHRLRYAIGPERIEGVWWNGHGKTRDYFEVEDEIGRCFWIFRVNQNSRWFLHGQFG